MILVVPGDCRSWVIDPWTGVIYGMIIATAPAAQESYMIPAYQVYYSIKSKLPSGTTVDFPTFGDAVGVEEDAPISPLRIMKPSTVVDSNRIRSHGPSPWPEKKPKLDPAPLTVPAAIEDAQRDGLEPRPSSMGTTKTSTTGCFESQPRASSINEGSSGVLQWYRFDRRGESWNVADRQRVPASQAELKYKSAVGANNVASQMAEDGGLAQTTNRALVTAAEAHVA